MCQVIEMYLPSPPHHLQSMLILISRLFSLSPSLPPHSHSTLLFTTPLPPQQAFVTSSIEARRGIISCDFSVNSSAYVHKKYFQCSV